MYAKLFDWSVRHLPEVNYRLVDTQAAARVGGGIVHPEGEGPWPGNMLFYIDVENLAAYLAKR